VAATNVRRWGAGKHAKLACSWRRWPRHVGCSWARVLRISRIDHEGVGLCLKVEGRLSGDWVALLENELQDAARETSSLFLDLAAVDFASLQAAQVLRTATARGVRVIACSPFLAKLLLAGTP
jgi:hypothetical protein